jgi:SAM-dependent methyltransferase
MDSDGYFGEAVAAAYDEDSAELFDPAAVEPAVDLLERLADGGSALELGIGTGRIALPLAARGVRVHGIELSRAMAARLAEKPGAASIEVTIGDFSTTRLDRTFTVAYLVFNTIMNLTTQDAQVACFQNVADHLEPGGCFVIEVMVPELRKLSETGTVVPFVLSKEKLGFDEYDTATQAMSSHHVSLGGDGAGDSSIPFRYVWPAELDLMARLAGVRLKDRWADWSGAPFTDLSRSHVSVWEKTA